MEHFKFKCKVCSDGRLYAAQAAAHAVESHDDGTEVTYT